MDKEELDKRFPETNYGKDPRFYSQENIKGNVRDLANAILNSCPDGREKSLALTKLEEVSMWACWSIDRNTK